MAVQHELAARLPGVNVPALVENSAGMTLIGLTDANHAVPAH